jgi:hypothetical protein
MYFIYLSGQVTRARPIILLLLFQQKFAALCYYRFFPHVHYSYANALEYLKLHTVCQRRYHLDALFLIQVCRGLKYCPSLLEVVGL